MKLSWGRVSVNMKIFSAFTTPSQWVAILARTPEASDGRTLVDEDTTTLPNGFVDLWLPRGLQVDVSMEARGLTVTERIGTFATDITCITTPKLHY